MANDAKHPPCSVYAIRCKENGKIYIGCTTNVQKRINEHMSELKGRRKPKVANVSKRVTGENWQRDYDKYGSEAFEFYILETDIKYSERLAKEKYWIDRYGACDPERGYNIIAVCPPPKYPIKEGLPPAVDELLAPDDTDKGAG